MKMKINVRKKIMPLALAAMLSATSVPLYLTQTNNVKAATSLSLGTQNSRAASVIGEDGIYKVDAQMMMAGSTERTSMANNAITHKVKLTVKDGKYYLTLNFKGMKIEMKGQEIYGYLGKIQYLDGDEAKDVTVDSVQKYTDGTIVKDDYGTDYPDIVTFPMTDEAVKTGIVQMKVDVSVMGQFGIGTQRTDLKVDLSSAVKTTDDDKDFSSEDVIEPVKTPEKPETPVTPPTPQQPSNTTTTVSAPAVPTEVKAVSADHDKVKVSWKKVNGAAGYEVYQDNKKAADVKIDNYTSTKLTTGRRYTYKVRAYKLDNGKKVYSGYSKNVTAVPNLASVNGLKVKNSAKKAAKISFKKINGANGYVIYRATKKNGKYKAVSKLKKGTAVTYTNKKLKKKKTYYYKVRAYKTIGKKTIYGAYSKTVSVKIKK